MIYSYTIKVPSSVLNMRNCLPKRHHNLGKSTDICVHILSISSNEIFYSK